MQEWDQGPEIVGAPHSRSATVEDRGMRSVPLPLRRPEEHHFRTLFDRSPVGMATVGLDGRWLEANDALLAFLGFTRDELLTRDFQSITLPEDLAPDLALVEQSLAGRLDHFQVTKRYVRGDGRVVWALLNVQLVRDERSGDPDCFLVQVVDVDAQHRLELALERERTAMRHLLDLHADIAVLTDEESALDAVIRAAMLVVPHSDGAVIELPEEIEVAGVPQEVLRYRAVTGRLSDQRDQVVDRHRSLSGRAFGSRVLLHSADTETDPRVDSAACRRTGIRSMLVAPLLAGTETLGVIKVAAGAPHAFDDGDAASLSLLAHSLTAALQHVRDRAAVADALADSEAANAELARVAAFRTELVGTIGHEIGTPLSVLVAATEMAQQEWGGEDRPEQHAYLELMERSAARIDRTVRDVLVQVTADSGHLVATPRVVEVHGRVAEALVAAGLSAPVAAPDPVTAWVQPEHLDQMLLNLLSNARKYGAEPHVEVEPLSDGRVRVAVVDRGAGVPPEFEDSLFERFSRSQTERGRAGGTGLGLAIVRELARANGGEASYEPTPGGGATFVLVLPGLPEAGFGVSAG